METSAPVRGFRPIPVFRGFTLKTPKPRNSIRSPDFHALNSYLFRHRHKTLAVAGALVGGHDHDTMPGLGLVASQRMNAG